jgi:transcriptional regulator with PAS, ATPase and Fis domain
VGGTSLIRVDFRLIAASNQPLEAMLADRSFRQDLFYRLNVIHLHIPPLRERKDDIVPLARHILLQRAVRDAAGQEISIDPEAQKALTEYPWPGNSRELLNVMEQIASFLDVDVIRLRDLPFHLFRHPLPSLGQDRGMLKTAQARAEEDAIHYALRATNNNKARAAEILGIHRTLLYKKMKKFNIPIHGSPPEGNSRA